MDFLPLGDFFIHKANTSSFRLQKLKVECLILNVKMVLNVRQIRLAVNSGKDTDAALYRR